MASINLYKKIAKADIKNRDGGYKALIYFAPVDTFTTIAAPSATALMGDRKKITDNHTFPVDEGFISLLCKLHSVTSKGTTIGDEGAQSIQWEFEGSILGDSAFAQEELETILNDNNIFLLKDQDCLNAGEFVQFGDECLQPTIKLEFDGKTTKEGNKEYKITGTVKSKKFWYSGAVTEKA
jgi:hypothetical protein